MRSGRRFPYSVMCSLIGPVDLMAQALEMRTLEEDVRCDLIIAMPSYVFFSVKTIEFQLVR